MGIRGEIMIKTFFHQFIYAPLYVFKEAMVALGLLLGLYQGICFFLPNTVNNIATKENFLVIIGVSLVYGRIRTWKKYKVDFRISNTDTTIELIFGDLFKEEGFRVIPVNEFFDSEIGKPVSEESLHGILIKKHMDGKLFDNVVDSQLSENKSETEPNKTMGKNKRYPIGTTVKITTDANYLLFALAETDPNTCKARCDVATMWKALEGFWQKARSEVGGKPINIPLVGSGLSGVGLPMRDLLNLIILSAIKITQKEKITSKIRVVLTKHSFEELDLQSIKKYWEE